MAKEYNTKDELSVPRSAAGAALRAARQGFVYDKFGIKTKFKAQVLSRPISVTGRDFGQSTKFGRTSPRRRRGQDDSIY